MYNDSIERRQVVLASAGEEDSRGDLPNRERFPSKQRPSNRYAGRQGPISRSNNPKLR